jgi:tetratricopeptide (TPR) repeat protein
MFEDLPADAAETIQEADRKEPEIIGNGFTDNDSIGAKDIPEAYQSGTLSGEDMVESSEEAIPANQCFAMAMKASQKRDYPEAIACFEKYIDQLPDEPKGHYNLAILHYRLREYDKASEHANTALQLGAKSSQKIIDKIESKRSQIKPEKPEESGEDALSSLLNDSLNFPTTGLKDPVGHDETASIWDADELDGDISQSLIAEATPENSFDIKDDVIVFNSAMAQDRNRVIPEEVSPANKPSLDDLKISARHHSSRHGAEELVANTGTTVGHDDNGMMPPSENGRVANLFKLGEKAIESKEFLKAIKHFTKVTHLAPEDPRGYYYLALVSCRLKFFETAREHATRAIEMGSEPAKKVLEEINAHQISS